LTVVSRPSLWLAVFVSRDPYANLTDEQVLARAARALITAANLPAGTGRDFQMALYDSAKAELDRRLAGHVLAGLQRKMQERGQEQ